MWQGCGSSERGRPGSAVPGVLPLPGGTHRAYPPHRAHSPHRAYPPHRAHSPHRAYPPRRRRGSAPPPGRPAVRSHRKVTLLRLSGSEGGLAGCLPSRLAAPGIPGGLLRPGGLSRPRPPSPGRSRAAGAEPGRWSIAVVLATAMLHRPRSGRAPGLRRPGAHGVQVTSGTPGTRAPPLTPEEPHPCHIHVAAGQRPAVVVVVRQVRRGSGPGASSWLGRGTPGRRLARRRPRRRSTGGRPA